MRISVSEGTVSAVTMFEGHFVFLNDIPVRQFLHGSGEGSMCKNRLEPGPRVRQSAVTLNKLIKTISLAALYHTEHNFGPSSV